VIPGQNDIAALAVLFFGLTAATVGNAQPSPGRLAQTYPSRPVTIVVPYAPGGGTDVLGRIVAERAGIALGQRIVVENMSGANGIVGLGRVARAAPDGYTISIGNWSAYVVNAAIYATSYDVVNDFVPIALLADAPLLIAAKRTMQAKDLNGLIAWLKANPDKASQGAGGVGSPGHVAGVLFQKETGTRFQHVPYRGDGPAMQDLVAGQIDLMIASSGGLMPHVQAGSINVYAVAAKTRLAALPDLPTVDEAGLPGFYISTWNALFAPKGTPKDIIARFNSAVVAALADPTVRLRLADLGQEIPPIEQQTPEALRALQKGEIEKWWPIIKAAGIKGE
jgi:tripartite-type tricarboxylate transporter receptor subunit TctC